MIDKTSDGGHHHCIKELHTRQVTSTLCSCSAARRSKTQKLIIALIPSYLGVKCKGNNQCPYCHSVKGLFRASAVGFEITGLHFKGYSNPEMSFDVSAVANGSQQTEGTSLPDCSLFNSFVKSLGAQS